MPPSVSVVIPAYNAREHLPECLDSVLRKQVTDELEVVVVDDGSTDGTRDCISAFPKVVYLAQDNRGPAAARNAGIARSQGTFIALLDADDLWPKGKLQNQIELLQKHPTRQCVLAIAVSLKAKTSGLERCLKKAARTPLSGETGPTFKMLMLVC